jgi:pteridine reductase
MPHQPLALVTGAAHRLGKAFALTLARNEHAILLHYWKASQEAAKTAEEIRTLGVPVFIFRTDLRDPGGIQELFAEADKLPHPLRVMVNSAAVMPAGDPLSLSVQEWGETINLNLRAPFLCARESAIRMQKGGLIVNITDIGAQKAWSHFTGYAVSKAGVEAMTKIMARAFAPLIRVNSIAPGLVLQPRLMPDEEWKNLIQRLPLQRAARIDEITAALEFLLKNEYITGQTLVVDGGYSLIG